jgi:hypothetical protein
MDFNSFFEDLLDKLSDEEIEVLEHASTAIRESFEFFYPEESEDPEEISVREIEEPLRSF